MGISFDITAEYLKKGMQRVGVKKKSVISSGKNSSVERGVCHLMSTSTSQPSIHTSKSAIYSSPLSLCQKNRIYETNNIKHDISRQKQFRIYILQIFSYIVKQPSLYFDRNLYGYDFMAENVKPVSLQHLPTPQYPSA